MSDTHMIGTYEIIEKVGSGGMATVYKAYHSRVNRYVALKVLHQMFLDDKNFVARFQREAQIVGRLDHPNIVPVYDFDIQDRQPYLVMKYIDGQTLKERMQDEPLTLDEIRHAMRSICDALTFAHEQGVLHRDIKPSNIIISTDNTVYLTDFGLARIAHQGESTLSIDTMLGTPHYISPEQAQSLPVDSRTDIYALGIILYELMAGRLPFTGESAFAIVHQQIYSAPPLPSRLNPDIKPAVETVLLKALSKSPEERYSTANELFRAFDNALTDTGTYTLDSSRTERAEIAAESISRHTPRGGRYQPTPVSDEQVFVNPDGSKSVIIPVLSADAVIPELTIKEWFEIVIKRIQHMVDDISDQTRDRPLQELIDETYHEIEGQVKQTIHVAQRSWGGEKQTTVVDKPKPKRSAETPTLHLDRNYPDDERQNIGIRNDNLAEWGMDIKATKRRRRSVASQRILFLIHVFLFVVSIGFLYLLQPELSSYVATLMQEVSVDIAIDIEQPVENIQAVLGNLANIPLWFVVAWGWGIGVLNHGLTMLDNTLDFRYQQRQNRIDIRMTQIYGDSWRDIATPQIYHQIRKKVNKRAKRRVSFWGHFISVVLSLFLFMIAKSFLNPVISEFITVVGDEVQPMENWGFFIVLLMLIPLVIHGLVYLVENLLDNDRREIKIQETIQKELYPSSNRKRKNVIEDKHSLSSVHFIEDGVRLTEDGEFSASFVHEMNGNLPPDTNL